MQLLLRQVHRREKGGGIYLLFSLLKVQPQGATSPPVCLAQQPVSQAPRGVFHSYLQERVTQAWMVCQLREKREVMRK